MNNDRKEISKSVLKELKTAKINHDLGAFAAGKVASKFTKPVTGGRTVFSNIFRGRFKVSEADGKIYHVDDNNEFMHTDEGKKITIEDYFDQHPETLDRFQ